ncbi:glycogen debranching protein GlgX [Croceibacterium aestuarii]|uniref:glycogen debranching protein GlgX n=1 Tax=Croceibacterium aestuarii TaxID=3064139 RepID=UPI00272EDF90|nr:glycogen debranching protein GlgX [Croceibacterium sp. D39]
MSFPERLEAGSPYPLGSTFDGMGVNFAVYSANAERIELCLFDPNGRKEIARFDLPEWTDEVWHGYLPDALPGLVYGYRAYGPYEPENGHRFNHHKLLLDPYAKQLVGELKWTDSLFGYRVRSRKADLSFDRRDSAPAMPKGVVTHGSFDWSHDRRPNTPWADTVIYEAHVRGLTKLFEEVAPQERGTFAALASGPVVDHLKRLGVTAIELLPIHAYAQDRFLLEKGLRNYWGYNTLSFFAPERRYFARPDLDELRLAVRRLHAAGIEVILDVVYNHTAEGSERGPTLSWRGLDNASYYRLSPDDRRYAVNFTGTGNTLNMSKARVIQMVADSLRYWVTSFGIDGFRFDLGTVLGRTYPDFNPGAAFFDVLRQDPVLQRVKLISEPWDIGPGGYQLGHHPPGFAEWNDRYRDAVRRYWRGDEDMRGELAARLAGSGDIFDRRARRPWASVNFVTSHDGFTLADTVSYEHRHNEANLEDNNDGHGENFSRNWGEEGPTHNPEIREMRMRIQRSMLVTLLASHGTPMLLGGDEFARTQGGNNNAYCQDNAISWFDWKQARSPEGEAMIGFVQRLIALRKRYSLLHSRRYLYGQEVAANLPDIDWWDERGMPLAQEDWDNVHGRALVMRLARKMEDGRLRIIALLMNGSPDNLVFNLPPPSARRRLLIDSAHPHLEEHDIGDSYWLLAGAAALIWWEVPV